MVGWVRLLELNEQRDVVAGSIEELAAAVKRGADLKSYTTFDYREHMDEPGSQEGLVQEMMSFSVTYWLEGGHMAGIQTTRYPANAALGFGDMPSLSFFLNNENGQNGIARLFLDGRKGFAKPPGYYSKKYKVYDEWDSETSCPSENFTYQFNEYGWWVSDSWEEILAHDAYGSVIQGSLKNLQNALRSGRRLKVGVQNLCADLVSKDEPFISHEVFIELHSVYNHHDSGFMGGESYPIVRVGPGVPLKYRSRNWNYGWILPRTDGIVHHLIINPSTCEFIRKDGRFGIRWFVQ